MSNDIVTEKFGQVRKTKYLYLVSIRAVTAVISTNLARTVKRMLTEESASLNKNECVTVYISTVNKYIHVPFETKIKQQITVIENDKRRMRSGVRL